MNDRKKAAVSSDKERAGKWLFAALMIASAVFLVCYGVFGKKALPTKITAYTVLTIPVTVLFRKR